MARKLILAALTILIAANIATSTVKKNQILTNADCTVHKSCGMRNDGETVLGLQLKSKKHYRPYLRRRIHQFRQNSLNLYRNLRQILHNLIFNCNYPNFKINQIMNTLRGIEKTLTCKPIMSNMIIN